MIFVFTCDRREMLLDNLKYLDQFNHNITVLDDLTPEDMTRVTDYADLYQSMERLGKKNYWQQWRTALSLARDSEDELYIFMPDDFLSLDINQIERLHETLKVRPYSMNLINDGRTEQFKAFKPTDIDIDGFKAKRIGFNDCGFFCNRKTLKLLQYRIEAIHPQRFFYNEELSSGVGQQLTRRMRSAGVYMLMPEISLAHHGDHPSIMHPTERLINPLISKH